MKCLPNNHWHAGEARLLAEFGGVEDIGASGKANKQEASEQNINAQQQPKKTPMQELADTVKNILKTLKTPDANKDLNALMKAAGIKVNDHLTGVNTYMKSLAKRGDSSEVIARLQKESEAQNALQLKRANMPHA